MNIELLFNVITTDLVEASALFYQTYFGFEVVANLEWYIHLRHPSSGVEIAFMLPNHPTQPAMYQVPYSGGGIIFSVQVDDIGTIYEKFQNSDVTISFAIKTEEWGQTHFGIFDPNGIPIDIVQHENN